MSLDIMRSAVRNLSRKRVRTLLMASGIIIGVCAVVVIMCIGRGARDFVSEQLGGFGINGLNIYAKSGEVRAADQLTQEDVQLVRDRVSTVQYAMPLIAQYGASYLRGQREESVLWGVDNAMGDIMDIELLHGRLFSAVDARGGEAICIISDTQALSAYKRTNVVGKNMRVYLGEQYHTLKVVGVIRSQSSSLDSLVGGYIPSFVYIPVATIQSMSGKTSIDQIMVSLKEGANMEAAGETILKLLHKKHNIQSGYKAENMVAQKDKLTGILEVITLVISAIAAVSLVVGGIGIMTLMLVTVGERVREIGIKKAVGATRGNIMLEFLMEAVIITAAGGAVGALLGNVTSSFVSGAFGIPYQPDASIIALSMGFCVTLGVVFGVYPAGKAASCDPIEALRRE